MKYQADILVLYFYLKGELDIEKYITTVSDIISSEYNLDLRYIGYNIYLGYNKFGLIKNKKFYYIEYSETESLYDKIKNNPILKKYNIELYRPSDNDNYQLISNKFEFTSNGFIYHNK